jgi:tripartite-type tricarboxylate transporter receptor subunit TctC
VVVENHPGAGGVTGTALVAKAAPDGYTLLAANPGPLTVAPGLRKDLGYDPALDLAPVILMTTVSGVVAAHPGVAAKTIGELLDLARRAPGRLRYGSAGSGTVSHLAMELLNHFSGTRMTHVPRQGLEEAVPALAAGALDVLVLPLPQARPLARDGKLRALAVTRRARSDLWPELPTVEEAGARGFESLSWNGVAAPAATPAAVVDRINAEIGRVLASREGSDYLRREGYEIAGGTPAAFGAFMDAERKKWREAARLAGLAR